VFGRWFGKALLPAQAGYEARRVSFELFALLDERLAWSLISLEMRLKIPFA